MSGSISEAKAKWAILASGWRQSGPPAAPSIQDVSNYVFNIPREKGKVLILGCTPSIRNGLLSEFYTVISIDITHKMIRLTKPLVAESDLDLVAQGNWLSLPLVDKSVDAVLGDKVIGNVMPEDWPILFSEVKRVLRPGGVFLTRATPHGDEFLEPPFRQDFKELVSKWGSLYKQGMKLEEACSGLWENCMDISTVSENASTGTQQLGRVLPQTKNECLIQAGDDEANKVLVQQFVDNYWLSKEAKWSAYTVQSIILGVGAYLEYQGSHAAADYPDADRQPVFHFIRKNETL